MLPLFFLLPSAIFPLLIMSPCPCVEAKGGDHLLPLIILPGQSANQLEARLTDAYTPASNNCRDHVGEGWFRLWVDRSLLQDPFLDCFAERMTLRYDPVIDDYRNAPGVKTRASYFGTTKGFQYQDPNDTANSLYMANFVKKLEEIGYKEGHNLFGAPYDFRYGLAAAGHPSRVGSKFLHDLKKLVEKASRSNGDKRVIILTHSFGGLLALNLLNRNPPAWRRHFVEHLITIGAPWGGSSIVVSLLASGNSFSFANLNLDPLRLRPMVRSWESNIWLLPSPKFFGHDPIVVTPGRNYSAFDMREFLVDIGAEASVGPYEARVLPLLERLDPPGVPVTCIAGTNVSTLEAFVYGEGGFDEQPKVLFGDGDGLVNSKSLLAIEKEWADKAQQKLKVVKLLNTGHNTIFFEDAGLREIIKEIQDVNSKDTRATARH